MLSGPFFRRLLVPYLLLICAAVAAVGIVSAARLRSSYLDRTRHTLHDSSRLVSHIVASQVKQGRLDELAAEVRRLGDTLGYRITIIRDDGAVIADNHADPAKMDNHRHRPEVVEASEHGDGTSVRASDTTGEEMFYFAHRAEVGGYFVRVAMAMPQLRRELRTLYLYVAVAVLVAMIGAGVISYFLARRRAAPIAEITEYAQRLARGDLRGRVFRREKGEIGALAGAVNSMADSLSQLIAQASKGKAELMAILSSMSEGVVATDRQGYIVLSNSAAADFLGFSTSESHGKLLWEVVRNEQVIKAANEVLTTAQRSELELGPLNGRHLEVTVCTWPLSQSPEGVVIVAHDATQAVRYQELRKEFVANVSHELRTPLSSIKGFTETLLNGALNNPDKAQQFLRTIDKHADQLTNLVNDLLELSRLESQPELPRRRAVDLNALVRKAADDLKPAADKKNQQIAVTTSNHLPGIFGDPDYLERAIINLLENAIKYTPEGGSIQLTTRLDNGHIIAEVIDNGIGIPEEDQPRIFERFYRVDRSRSREMGGTGLGLSIVKHIVQAHRGTLEVQSALGKGSTFRLKLPRTPGG